MLITRNKTNLPTGGQVIRIERKPDGRTVSLDIGHWILDIGYWTLDIGHLTYTFAFLNKN